MKKLSNLKGAKALSKKEQQSINGGGVLCRDIVCPRCYKCGQFGCYFVGGPDCLPHDYE